MCVRALIRKYIRDNHDANRQELIAAFGQESIDGDEHLPLGIENLNYESVSGCLLCGGMTFSNVRVKGTFVTTPASGADAADVKAAMALSDRSTEVDLVLGKVIVMVPWKDILVKRWKAKRFLKSLEQRAGRDASQKQEQEQAGGVATEDPRELFTLDIPLLRVYGATGRITQHPVQNVAAAAALNMNRKTQFAFRLGNVRLTRADVRVQTARPGKVTARGAMVPAKQHPPIHVSIQDLHMLDFLNTRSLFHDVGFRSVTSGAIDGRPFSLEVYRSYLAPAAAASAADTAATASQTDTTDPKKKQMVVEAVTSLSTSDDTHTTPEERHDEKIVSIWRGETIALPALLRLLCPTMPLTGWFDSAETNFLVRTVESPDQKPEDDVTMHWSVRLKNSSVTARPEALLGQLQPDDRSDLAKRLKEAVESFKPLVNMLNMEKEVNMDFAINVQKQHLLRADAERALRQIVVDIVVKELQRRAAAAGKKYANAKSK